MDTIASWQSPLRGLCKTRGIAAAGLAFLMGLAPARGVTLIGTNPNSPGLNTNMLSIQTSPFSVASAATLNAFPMSGIDFNPLTGVLYGTTGNQGTTPGTLFIINGTYTTANAVGSGTGFAQVSGLTFDINGDLYGSASTSALSYSDRLIKIDPTTGVGTYVGLYGSAGGYTIEQVDSLSISPLNGKLYASSGQGTAGSNVPYGRLFEINKTTGAATLLGTLLDSATLTYALNAPISGLDFDASGNLYGSLGNNDGRIVQIDPVALTYTVLGDATAGTSNASVSSIAVVPTVVPEPGRFLLFGLGLGLLSARRKRPI